ncbi:MAG: type II toxin-antitoxin system RelE/ParE family toxin [Clostridia bacterium]|nr:type II toxin-antitoxin system RelE/ParE family toxin [Clostridia bacterium]
MKLLYSRKSIEDIENTTDYIENQLNNPAAAHKLKTTLLKKISHLKENPEIGMKLSDKIDIESDYRYIIINKQIVFYQIHSDYIEIIRILDGRTDYMTHLF